MIAKAQMLISSAGMCRGTVILQHKMLFILS